MEEQDIVLDGVIQSPAPGGIFLFYHIMPEIWSVHITEEHIFHERHLCP